jgi:hypothetical protein
LVIIWFNTIVDIQKIPEEGSLLNAEGRILMTRTGEDIFLKLLHRTESQIVTFGV